MKFQIKHKMEGRIRVHLEQGSMTCREADLVCAWLEQAAFVQRVKAYPRTGDVAVWYLGDRKAVLKRLGEFHYEIEGLAERVPEQSGRSLAMHYQDRLIETVLTKAATSFLLPAPVRAVYTTVQAVRYIAMGIRSLIARKLEVEVLDATAITVSLLRGDFKTASSVMFLLKIGEILEEWTHKKSVDDLARSMSLQVEKVWKKAGDQEVLVSVRDVQPEDEIVVRMGNLIPLDGVVQSGEAMVNQASLTGESIPVWKVKDAIVYAGTVVEEGEIVIRITGISGSTRYEKIVHMIEESEQLKSSVEGKAAALADRLVPFSLGGTILTWFLTRNVQKALSILMVDFSCALKLAMPIAVLSAMREAGQYQITVKGGKYLEAVAQADTLVFDKTGTLTEAKPRVACVIPFGGKAENEILRTAACLEEHFPHSMATAVVQEAKRRGLQHEEMHSKVHYIVAHGIASSIGEDKVVIGSYHFVFEDEKCRIPENEEEKFREIPDEYSHLYLAISGMLAAVICIEDPLRPEVPEVIEALRKNGFRNLVMMTGDSHRTAAAIAARIGVDSFDSEVLPEDKAYFVKKEQEGGHKVIMIGDGINDSPALSAADAGIAISSGAAITREVADIMITGDGLNSLVPLRQISTGLMKRIQRNYRFVIGFNLGLILLGVAGILMPATSALLHNCSTLYIGMSSMTNLLKDGVAEQERE